MNCKFCGNSLTDGCDFCTRCGKPTGAQPQDELTYWVALAHDGNQQAMSTLYEKTYSKVFYTVKSIIKNDDEVLDILQDTYIKVFTHLDTFEGNEKFLPWVKQIAANTARDWLKKKKPKLFSEMSPNDEQDITPEEFFEDERSNYIPEHVIDQNETKRLIREIIDDLPDDQRAVIGMYYYEGMSVKEIAAVMESTESAIKSRLMYGRKKIEKNVLELEKKGTKLYGLAPIPFLLLLFRNQNASAAEIANSQILQRVLENTSNIGKAAYSSAGASAGTPAGTTASVGGTIGAVKIALISIITTLVIGLSFLGVTRLVLNNNNQINDYVTENNTEAVEPATEKSPVDEAMEQYSIIISNAPSYQYDPYGSGNISGKYRYAIVWMQSDDNVPTLLLEQETTDYMYYMRAFKYDPDTKTVHQPPESLIEGTARTGGYRGSIALAGDGRGIIEINGSSLGSATYYRAVIKGDSLVKTVAWEGDIFRTDPNISTVDIDWHDIGDLSANSRTAETGEAAQSETSAEEAQPAADISNALPVDGNRNVLTGTLGTYSYNEVVSLQGQPDPNAQWANKNQTYRLIVLDTPQTISAKDIDYDIISNTVSIISVQYADGLDKYMGQHVVFSIDPNSTFWPADTSLPLGAPSTKDINVLEVLN